MLRNHIVNRSRASVWMYTNGRVFSFLTLILTLFLPAAQGTPPDPPAPFPLFSCEPDEIQAALASVPPYETSAVETFIRIEDGQFAPEYIVRGVNYYPTRYPWRRFFSADLNVVREEFTLLRETGFNTLRIFLWHDALFNCEANGAVPEPEAFQRLDAIIHEAAEQDFRLIVTLNDLADLRNAPLYDSPPHNIAQIEYIVSRYRDEAAILAWDLRNEGDIDYWSVRENTVAPFREVEVIAWLGRTAELVRGLDSNHLITAGWFRDAESTAAYVDFVSFHHWEDSTRLLERLEVLRDAIPDHMPILLEEFGYSTFRVSPEEQAETIRDVVIVAEGTGLLGWMVWAAFDFPLDVTCSPRPSPCVSADNSEHHYGLYESDYTPKPALTTLMELLSEFR
jgi:endo-1,4-beta-mannosidase